MNGECSTENAPDSGTTSGSRQTLITGEAVRGAAFLLRDAMLAVEEGTETGTEPVVAHGDGFVVEYADGNALRGSGRRLPRQDPVAALAKLEGREFSYEYLEKTDKLGADVPNPKSHVAYGYATHVVILDDDGRVTEVHAAHDSGKVVNPIAIQGQIEGGVLMGMGYALTEKFDLKDGVPQVKFGTLGLFARRTSPTSTPSTSRRTSCSTWATAPRASARSPRSPPRPRSRTPTVPSPASSRPSSRSSTRTTRAGRACG